MAYLGVLEIVEMYCSYILGSCKKNITMKHVPTQLVISQQFLLFLLSKEIILRLG
jgi:hypothetical protein